MISGTIKQRSSRMKYTVYFDEKSLKEDGDLITVCTSVESITEAVDHIKADMKKRNLPNDSLYMYKLYEDDYTTLNECGLPGTQELYWEELPHIF